MKPSPQIEKLIRDTVVAYQRGDIKFIEETTSRQPGVVVIGTDAPEYAKGFERIISMFRTEFAEFSAQVKERVVEIRAYEHGDVGWSDGIATFEANGKSVEVRNTSVCIREDGQWRCVQHHASIGVPNERMFDPLFKSHNAAT